MGDAAHEAAAVLAEHSDSLRDHSYPPSRWPDTRPPVTTPTASAKSFLSTKDIPARERLIVALDVPSREEAERLVEDLGDSVSFYKLGLELFMAEGYFQLVKSLREQGKKVFVDLKFFDVPATVHSAVLRLREHGAEFVSVHGNDAILKAACSAKNGTKILAVTVLTSLDEADMLALGFRVAIEEVVLSRAERALEIGCDGIISSGIEARGLRENHGGGFVIVCPGIRPGFSEVEDDDQKRTVNVEQAFVNGADYIVVGRPIRNASSPRDAAEEFQRRIAAVLDDAR